MERTRGGEKDRTLRLKATCCQAKSSGLGAVDGRMSPITGDNSPFHPVTINGDMGISRQCQFATK